MVKENQQNKTEGKEDKLAGLYGTAEWFITAISVTLVFIVFEMQAYTIPTGSMADTLRGAHFRLRCTQCAYEFSYNFHSENYKGVGENRTPGKNVDIRPESPRCPNCGFYQETKVSETFLKTGQIGPKPVMKGDRIFVAKCIYQFREPKRWDVVVFKNPTKPYENYIKRMVGLSGEKIEIIDGDVYIDDKIARKPEDVQEELWMCVYNNDYQPKRPEVERFNGHAWSQPFVNDINSSGNRSNWDLSADGPTVFKLTSDPGETHNIVYDTEMGNDFRATYAYDEPAGYPYMPICSDLLTRFYVRKGKESVVGVDMSKYGIRYRGWVEPSRMVIGYYNPDGEIVELDSVNTDSESEGDVLLHFSNVDHQLKLEYGEEKLVIDLGRSADSAGERKELMPRVSIFGSGEVVLSHISIYRDIHYTDRVLGRDKSGQIGFQLARAREGHAFQLEEDQFFVLGDNSPASADARFWATRGLGNNGERYRAGTVPRDYLIGKAFFVYWPGPYRPGISDNFLRIIPNVEGMKTIKGGSIDWNSEKRQNQ